MKQETFESFATDYIAAQSNRAREYGMVYQALKQGANWQREQDKELSKTVALHFVEPIDKLKEKIEQDKELIKELLESLELAKGTLGSCILMRKNLYSYLNIENIREDKEKINEIITKAENYLKQ